MRKAKKMNNKRSVYKKKLKQILQTIRRNPFYLSSKSNFRLILGRSKEHINYTYPLLIVSGLQRSGTSLLTQLLRNHHQILSYFSELHIGRPNKYRWPELDGLKNEKEKFKTLIPLNLAKKFLAVNDYNNFVFDFAFFKRLFLKLEKNNLNGKQRVTLNNFFTAYFNAYLNCNHSNFYDCYQFIAASIPGLTLFNKSISGFLKDYQDGILLVMVREPFFWWNSARHHSNILKKEGLKRYQTSLKNTVWACRQYPTNVCVVSFDNLIKSTEESIKVIFEQINLEFSHISTFPSNFPLYGKDNSTFGHNVTNKIQTSKLNRKLDIPDFDKQYIDAHIYPNYKDIMKKYVVNNF